MSRSVELAEHHVNTSRCQTLMILNQDRLTALRVYSSSMSLNFSLVLENLLDVINARLSASDTGESDKSKYFKWFKCVAFNNAPATVRSLSGFKIWNWESVPALIVRLCRFFAMLELPNACRRGDGMDGPVSDNRVKLVM